MEAKHTTGPSASYVLSIDASTGYQTTTEGICTPDQYGAAMAVLHSNKTDLETELLNALESVWLWMENQSDGQSKGGHATFDLMMLREQRDIARAAIAKATGDEK